MRHHLCALFFSLLLQSGTLIAQTDSLPARVEPRPAAPAYRSLSTTWSTGVHSYSSKLFRKGRTHAYNALDVRYAFQTSSAQPWAQESGYPAYGVGAYMAFLGDEERFGRPIALYGFLNQDLFRLGQQRVEAAFSLGLAADLARYSATPTPILEYMGSRVTVFFDLRLGLALRLTRELDLTTGIYFTHMSNGRTFLPNYGINASGIYLGTRYYYNVKQGQTAADPLSARYIKPADTRPARRTPASRHSISLYAAGATVQNFVHEEPDLIWYKRRFYPLSVLLDYDYQLTGAHTLNTGLDYFRDPSLNAYNIPAESQISLGAIHLGYRYRLWRLSLGLQMGTYITSNRGKDALFLRPSLRYDISPRLYAQIGLKTRNGATADWVEWGLGFKLLRF